MRVRWDIIKWKIAAAIFLFLVYFLIYPTLIGYIILVIIQVVILAYLSTKIKL